MNKASQKVLFYFLMILTIVISIPAGVLAVTWLGTLWRGKILFHSPMLFALGFVSYFVTGGIGLAPLRPAILDVLAERDRYGKVLLLYGSRTPDDILYGDEMRRWADLNDVNVQMTVDNAPYGYKGKVGFVTELITRAGFDPRRAWAFVCGPEVMMRSAASALNSRGVPKPKVRLSMERSMKCGIGLCGHCQLRELFICVDGPVLSYDRLEPLMNVREL